MEYFKPIRCRFCGEVRPLDSFVGSDYSHKCKDCEAKEQELNDAFFSPDNFASWNDVSIIEGSKLKRLVGWCFG